ncbi:putative Armadillo/beta-catenin-like repeat family protein [Tripterygium wilfordii]|uniref:RING-type E3 ubiquitin transferase n=1 Tax=Tripterygium wilfordii TaxID=458696 RepID=A0A7J7DG67_TRIWF|nr:putative U-box domain-containing protein 42 [Tripterygium wilfordii]KAF5745331.1 putative Armadillo/beta-catenin-like repeat family protein [Tripterygium wilfordii]
MSLNTGTTAITSLADSLLGSISEIIESTLCSELEQEIFAEFGCYLYRSSPAIMELQTTENTPPNAMNILQSLSESIDLAKDLVKDCQTFSDSKVKNVIAQLEMVIKQMGESLSLIPSSTFRGQEYAEVAVKSLSSEMQNAHFEVSQTKASQTKELLSHMLPAKDETNIEAAATESDLYSVNVEVSMEIPQTSNKRLIDFLKSASSSSQRSHNNTSGTVWSLPQVAQYIEPLYASFYCPLTKQIMDDPVTVESGVTYERKAITEWFKEFERLDETLCPITGQKLLSRALSTNRALKTTIEEWKERNETARIKVARAALSLASSETMVLEAIKDLQGICQRKPYNKIQIRNIGMFPSLVNLLEHKARGVRCATLELLRLLTQEDDDGKEILVKAMDISTIIKLLSSSHQAIRHASLLLLLELSRSQNLCDIIGSVAGMILMLITMKYNQRAKDDFASTKAHEILQNLEKCTDNIKHMAENGLLEPLLNHLAEGSEEMQIEMASFLGEIVLGHESKTFVAERASSALVKMIHGGNSLSRKAAFKALNQISAYHPNGKVLLEAGIVQAMAEELFTRRIYNEPMNSKNESAAILANIIESGVELENIQVRDRGHKLNSDYVVYNIVCMVRNSTPDDLNINLIRILLGLTNSPRSLNAVVSMVKETEVSYTLIELINNPYEALGAASMKLLIALAPYMGHKLVEKLCKTSGQPESLIKSPPEISRITEKQALSAKFLAKLPHQNLTLNLALLCKNTVPIVLQAINQIQRSGTRICRYAGIYLEALVGILVRFTTTLYEPQMLFLARNYNFTLVFTELLTKTSSNEVQKLSAIGLENLSLESINLSKAPPVKRKKFMKVFHLPRSLSLGSSKGRKVEMCPVHRGACSSQNTFCLVDAKAVERLLACLEHENSGVVEAALNAICTLLDDKVDLDKSITMLSRENAIQHVLNVVKEHREEGLRQKSFWVIERFLMKGGDKSASDISQNRMFSAELVTSFHHGNDTTRQMAEKILTRLNMMPNYSTTYYTL